MRENLHKGSWIRKLFDEGARLKKELGEEQVFDFSIGNPITKPPKTFTKALLEEAASGNHGYVETQGLPETRLRVAQFLTSRYATEFNPDHIIMTVGAGGALNIVLKSILNCGEEVILLAPYFAEYESYIKNYGGKVVRCLLTSQFKIDIEAVSKAITPKTKAIIINTPHNPTGTILSQKNLNDVGALLKQEGERIGKPIYMIFDEPYSQLIYDAMQANPFLSYPYVVLVSSFSKDLGIAGERLGYIGLNKNIPGANLLTSAFVYSNRTLGFVNAPVLMQRAIAKMTDFTMDINAYKDRRNLIVDVLEEAGFEFAMPRGGFFVFPKAPISDDIKFCIHAAQKYNLLLVPSSGFGLSGYFRVSFSVPIEQIKKSREVLTSLNKDFS